MPQKIHPSRTKSRPAVRRISCLAESGPRPIQAEPLQFDLHEGKKFRVRDYHVTWERGRNWLVSPYYPSSGGTVIDWLPPEAGDEGGEEEGAEGEEP